MINKFEYKTKIIRVPFDENIDNHENELNKVIGKIMSGYLITEIINISNYFVPWSQCISYVILYKKEII